MIVEGEDFEQRCSTGQSPAQRTSIQEDAQPTDVKDRCKGSCLHGSSF